MQKGISKGPGPSEIKHLHFPALTALMKERTQSLPELDWMDMEHNKDLRMRGLGRSHTVRSWGRVGSIDNGYVRVVGLDATEHVFQGNAKYLLQHPQPQSDSQEVLCLLWASAHFQISPSDGFTWPM